MTFNNIDLDVSLQSEDWQNEFPDYQDHITACLTQIAQNIPEARNFGRIPHLELSILLTDDHNIRQLNRQYRDRDKPTNVLSFPSLSGQEMDIHLRQGSEIPDHPIALGDVVLAYETVRAEAGAQGKTFPDHFCHLFIHGMLHLLGYDHMEKAPAQEMEAMEKKMLSKLSIDDPYQD